VDMRI